jgi:hypothetical protein
VGDCGFYVPYGDVRATVKGIREALDAPQFLGEKARNRMLTMFSMEKKKISVTSCNTRGNGNR